ncbi:MAG TPA: GxxExxY protein [Gammaproteobacteria bacterium]|nr:GxxExxY protein [Gammaproteobacteria bacterium]
MMDQALTRRVIGSAIEVHKVLGPGLLESAYQDCLEHEMNLAGLLCERQVPVSLDYKGLPVGDAYRVDLLVENRLVVELKAVEQVVPLHKAQLLTYLRLLQREVGLLINFNVVLLKDGIHRVVNNL